MSSYNTAKNVLSAQEYDAVRGKKSEEKAQRESKKDLGTIFMGPQTSREMSIDDILGQSTRALWNKNTEEEYMTRLKEKAVLKVKSLLARAEEKAQERIKEAEEEVETVYARAKEKEAEAQKLLDEAQQLKLEAENIKADAITQGYNQGLHQAQAQLDEAREEFVVQKGQYAKACSNILLHIHEQCITIFDSWRSDLTELLLDAVEKSTGYIRDNEKTAILQALLWQSVNALLDKREYKVRVNPSEAMLLTELMEEVNRSFGLNSKWSLESDSSLEEGSIVVESPSGLIRNEKNERESLVKEVLEKLHLPLGEGDQNAYDNITKNLVGQAREVKIPLSPEEEQAYAEEERQSLLAKPSLINKEFAQENEMPAQEAEFSEMQENNQVQADIQEHNAAQTIQDVQMPEPDEPETAEELAHGEENLVEEAMPQEQVDIQQEIQSNSEENLTQKASQMVEEELAHIGEEIAEETKPQKAKKDVVENENGYTTELADELLNEMGFN